MQQSRQKHQHVVGFLCALARCETLSRVWYSRMIVLVPLELTEYDYEYNNDPRNTLHAAGPLAHRRGL